MSAVTPQMSHPSKKCERISFCLIFRLFFPPRFHVIRLGSKYQKFYFVESLLTYLSQ